MSWWKKEEPMKESTKEDSRVEETVSEKRMWQMKNIFVAFWIFVVLIIIAFVMTGFFQWNFTQRTIMWTVLTVIYAVILFFLLEPKLLRQIITKETKTVDREVIKEVTIDRPVNKDVIREVPVIKTVTVNRPVYIQTPRQKLDIPKYDFVGSSVAKTYHTRNCRLGKLIKKKYKESSNDISFFKKRGYRACKVCVLKEFKV